MTSKRILIIGGTGAQGTVVVDALRKAADSFTIRVLTRNPAHFKAKELKKLGVEIAKGLGLPLHSYEYLGKDISVEMSCEFFK